MQKIANWIMAHKAQFFFCGVLASTIILALDCRNGFYWQGVLVKVQGIISYVILFGITLSLYEAFTEKKRKKVEKERVKNERILRYREEIEDFLSWDEKEATYRIVGNIKRLNKEGITEIYLKWANLEGAKLMKANLKGAKLSDSNLKRADLEGAKLMKADLKVADLRDSNLRGANLREADLRGSDFRGADLKRANLGVADLRVADLRGSDLKGVKLLGAKLEDAIANEYQKQSLIHAGADITGVKFE